MTDPIPPRRRVLCVRPQFNPRTPPFLVGLMNEWVEALGLHADLFIVEKDFDYGQICDLVEPDYVVFEDLTLCRPCPLRISNIGAHSSVPRIGFAWGDPHDIDRMMFWQLFDQYRMEAFISYAYEHPQHMPELRGFAYSTHLFFDPAVFRDYGLEKTIPVSVFGGLRAPRFYHWRLQTTQDLIYHFPTFVYAHPGDHRRPAHPYPVHGEAYARLLNQSHFSLADTTRLDYVVRKHLEIPATGAVLVSPDTPPVADYGFVDMENCVLGSGCELRDKIRSVADDPVLYERIRQAGMAHVHGRFTRAAWRTLPEWFECRRLQGPGTVVQQVGQFGPFRLVPAGEPRIVSCEIPENDVTRLYTEVRSILLEGGSLDAAEAALAQARAWISYLIEPSVLGAVVALLRGDPHRALNELMRPRNLILGRRENCGLDGEPVVAFDPVEVAWVMVTAWIAGNADLVTTTRNLAATMQHLALRRALWLLDGAHEPPCSGLHQRLSGDRFSVNWLGQEALAQWCALLRRVLEANAWMVPEGLRQRSGLQSLEAALR